MSYFTISQCAADSEFLGRLTAAVAQEGVASPESPAFGIRWPVAAAADIEAAYASALAAGNEHPGSDPAVITDGMILSAVQAHVPGG